ncbi:MAG: hypothetical protein C0475_04485 [Planctomyces sp.]|nr:hypothetical protein [Planctomyces sp.]MBA4039145.1 hypothetical protein [Planctomyces sp.]MBA4120051.1 hypothetical protein [Isosphaera sp.]
MRKATASGRAFTAVEILVVIALLGLVALVVVPLVGSGTAVRAQAVVRSITSDLALAQSEAQANQQRHAVVFDVTNSTYAVCRVLPPGAGELYQPIAAPTFTGGVHVVNTARSAFGGARITAASFNGNPAESVVIFDELGAPVLGPDSEDPGTGGTVRVQAGSTAYDIVVEPVTGRTTVRRVDAQAAGGAQLAGGG